MLASDGLVQWRNQFHQLDELVHKTVVITHCRCVTVIIGRKVQIDNNVLILLMSH